MRPPFLAPACPIQQPPHKREGVLEAYSRAEFNDARIGRSGDDAKVRRCKRVSRRTQIRMIECVVERTPHFQVVLLSESEVLLQVDIEVDITRVSKRVRAELTEGSNGVLSESSRVEPVCNLVCPRLLFQMPVSDDIRSILSNPRQGVVYTRKQRKRGSRIQGCDPTKLPPSDPFPAKLGVEGMAAERLPDEGGHPDLRLASRDRTVVGVPIVWIARALTTSTFRAVHAQVLGPRVCALDH